MGTEPMRRTATRDPTETPVMSAGLGEGCGVGSMLGAAVVVGGGRVIVWRAVIVVGGALMVAKVGVWDEGVSEDVVDEVCEVVEVVEVEEVDEVDEIEVIEVVEVLSKDETVDDIKLSELVVDSVLVLTY